MSLEASSRDQNGFFPRGCKEALRIHYYSHSVFRFIWESFSFIPRPFQAPSIAYKSPKISADCRNVRQLPPSHWRSSPYVRLNWPSFLMIIPFLWDSWRIKALMDNFAEIKTLVITTLFRFAIQMFSRLP